MPTVISGDTGIDKVQDGAVVTADLADGAVTAAKTQMGATPAMVRLNTANGYGSSGTMIRRFTNVVTNQGSDITYVDSATAGASFTINTAGVYAISFSDSLSAGEYIGISKNAASLSTGIQGTAIAAVLIMGSNVSAGVAVGSCAWTGYLAAGDVIRPHNNGTTSGATTNAQQFTIARVA